jgi:peptide/nickel transport system substrate-binding protein
MTAPTNENNYGYYSNAEFDRVIQAAMRETDEGRRQTLYRRAQEIVYLEDPGAVWLFDNQYIVAARRGVEGVAPSPLGVVTFERAVVR